MNTEDENKTEERRPEEAAAAESAGNADAAEQRPHPAEPAPARREPVLPLPSSLQEIVGALLFASESPLSAADLRECVRSVHPVEGENAEVMSIYESCTSREIENALHGLEKELERSGVGFRLVNTGGTYRLQTAPPCGRYVRALLHLDRPTRLSRASLETLAIIAYRQPISKAEVEQIRGVSVDTMVKTLMDLQLVRLVGRSELPGHPYLYGTTPLFLEHFGLASLQQLNELDPTLQRDDPKERAKKYEKKKPPEPSKETEDEDGEKEPDLPGMDANGDVIVEDGDTGKGGKSPAGSAPAPAEDNPAGDDAADAEEGDGENGGQATGRPIFLMPPVIDDDEEDEEEDEFDEEDDEEDELDEGEGGNVKPEDLNK